MEWGGGPLRLTIGALFVLSLYGMRRGAVSLTAASEKPLLAALLDPRTLAILAGAGSGYTVAWSGIGGFESLVSLTMVVAVCWSGIAVGCGLDLRVLQKSPPLVFLVDLGQAGVAVCLVALAFFGASRLPGIPAPLLLPAGYLLLAAICVVDLPPRRTAAPPRSRVGSRHGFLEPSAAAFAAILLVALGSSLAATGGELSWRPQWASLVPPSLSDIVQGSRILCGLLVGAFVGFLSDLASREETLSEGLFFVVTALALLGGGVATTLHLDPLWMGLAAGVWFVNATLRRLDVVHVVERGRNVLKYTLPLLAGWVVGWGSFTGFETKAFAAVILVVLVIRPAVKIAGLRVALQLRLRHGKHLSLVGAAEACELDEIGVAIALSLAALLPVDIGAAVVAAVMAAQLLLRLVSAWGEGASARVARAGSGR